MNRLGAALLGEVRDPPIRSLYVFNANPATSSPNAGRIVEGLMKGGRVELVWKMPSVTWPKDWAKLLMNAVLIATDCLPRGGTVTVAPPEGTSQRFCIVGVGPMVRLSPESERALAGEFPSGLDGRSIQPYLTSRIAKHLGAKLAITMAAGEIRLAGE